MFSGLGLEFIFMSGLRIFSMEKERCLETGTGDIKLSEAWSTSVGVGGGEERRLEFKELVGEDDIDLQESGDSLLLQ